MNKRKFTALLMVSVMLCSSFLTACRDANSNTAQGGFEQPPHSDGDITTEAPKRDTVTGNDDTFVQAEGKATDLFAGYRKEDIFASLGIQANDYVDVIVSLEGDTLLDKYLSSKSALSVAEYTAETGSTYKENMLFRHSLVQQEITRNIDSGATFTYSYTLADNGFAARVKYGDVSKIRALASVKEVRLAEEYGVPDETTTTYYSTQGASLAAAEVGEVDVTAGEGAFLAILDTALDAYRKVDLETEKDYDHQPGHPAFSGKNIDIDKAAVNKTDIATVMTSTNAYYYDWHYNYSKLSYDPTVDNYYFNNKVVFAFDYGNMDSNVMPSGLFATTLDHGTHTAGIAVGCDPDSGFYGAAPAAQLAFMKVFYEDFSNGIVTTSDIDIALAIEDCIMLGVDAINLSLGSARGFSADNTSENYIWQTCKYADQVGINVQAAVGNNFNGAAYGVNGDYPLSDYPDYGAVNSPASFNTTLAVGSYNGENVEQHYAVIGEGASSFKVSLTDPEKTLFLQSEEKNFRSIPNGTHEWVYVNGEGSYSDFVNAGVNGKIAVVTARELPAGIDATYEQVFLRDYASDQMVSAIRAGATGIIYADRTYSLTRTVAIDMDDSNVLPFCGISRVDADRLKKLGRGTLTVAEDQVAYNLMSVFSSWGPTNTLNIKPEIIGLGGNVYSSISYSEDYGYMISDERYLDYGVYSGTSMAAPQVTAYVAMLKTKLRKQNPTLTAQELAALTNRILMSTATPLVDTLSDDESIYSPRYQGAGAVNYEAATATKAYLSVIGSDKAKLELGEDEKKTGVYFLNFSINNMSASALSYKLSTDVLTDALLADGRTVSLTSHEFEDYGVSIRTSGGAYNSATGVVSVPANGTVSVAMTITLTAEHKKYLDDNFANGSYVEGFVRLADQSGVADLSIPFLAFYGDWERSAFMDATVYDGEDAYLFASSLIGTYYGGFFSGYLGQYQYEVPENFAFVNEVNGEFVKGDIVTYEDLEFDGARLAIGSKTGGFNALSRIHLGLLRNAEKVEFYITNAATGELYASHTAIQMGRASYLESYGGMYPVIQGVSYGSNLPNNTVIKLSVRASFGDMSGTVNVKDQVDFYIAIDSEAPRLYTDSAGIIKQNGRVYLSINVYDNHTLAAIGVYGSDATTGVSKALGAPLPVDTSKWVAGEKNTLVYDITDYVADFRGEISVLLEDSAMNAVSYRLTSYLSGNNGDEEEKDVFATRIDFNREMNLAVTYSTDLGVVTQPANAKYELAVISRDTMSGEDYDKYQGEAYIDNTGDVPLLVAAKAGYVKVVVSSGDIHEEADVYIYVVDGEWIFQLNTGWVQPNDLAEGFTERTYGVYRYIGEGTHVTIPSTYTEPDGTECDVVYAGYTSFYGDYTLQSITIPNTIVRICDEVFEYNRNLRTVNFEQGSRLKYIGSMAFESCSSLTSIEFPASLVSIDGRAFYHCTKLKSISFEENSRLTSLAYSVFSDTALEEVELPDGVTSIGDSFSDIPSLRVLKLPDSVKAIGSMEYTALTEIYIPDGVTMIPMNAFEGCTDLRKVSLPDSITSIGARAFMGCISLTSITIPANTTKIDSDAFAYCSRLLNVRFGNALKEIDDTAFVGCTSLRTVYFDRGTQLTDLGTDVFYGCYSLQEFTVHPQNPYFMADDGILYRSLPGEEGEYELYCVPSNKLIDSILIRPDVAQIRDFAFAYHTELRTVLFSRAGALRQIGDYAFAACTSLNMLNLESASRLSKLGNYAFAYCTSLKSIGFPESLTAVSSYAFYMDTYLETVSFHPAITRIESYAFGGCIRYMGTDGKGTLKLPNRINWLGTGAFMYNRSLLKLDMGDCTAYTATGTNCGEAAFLSCYKLREVILPTSTTMIWEDMFADCTALEKINLGDTKVHTIRREAFYGCDSLREVTLPETLEILYSYAFAFSGLTHIEIPASMSQGPSAGHIWSYAFAGCTALESVTFPSTLTGIPNYAFAETALREVTLPKGLTLSGFSSNAFYMCSALERFIVEEGNLVFAATEEGILYLPASGEGDEPYLLLCPSNLQAETLVIDEMFTTIPSGFFQLAQGIDTVVIPATVKSVEAGAFYYSGVRQVIFAEDSDVLFDGYDQAGMFNGCSNLEYIALPGHITTIPYAMFANCVSLVSIELPETVKEIYPDAFFGCFNLKDINLENVEAIYGSAFAYCESLKELHLGKDLYLIDFSLNATAFEGCSSLEAVTVDAENMFFKAIDGVLFDKTGAVLYLYPAAKAGSEYVIPEGVSKVNELAFGFNKNLEKVVLPESMSVIGTFAFYQTEKLLDYYFLGYKAPALEGQYIQGFGTEYANFYDFSSDDFGDMYLALHYPEGGVGYDNWLYVTFFYTSTSFTQSGYTPPQQNDITKPNEGSSSGGSQQFGDRLRARIEDLKRGASEGLKNKLDALLERFELEYDSFFDMIDDADASKAYEDAYIREAERISMGETELFSYMWERIYAVLDRIVELKETKEYSEENLALLDQMAYSAIYTIVRSSTFAEVDFYYNYYYNYVNGLPAIGEEGMLEAVKMAAFAEIDGKYEAFSATAEANYDADVIAYVDEKYELARTAISGSSSAGEVEDGLASFDALLAGVPTKAGRAAFDEEKAAQLARFDKYVEENYEYKLWLILEEYIADRRTAAEEIFVIAEIEELIDFAIEQIEMQTSKLDTVQAQKLALLDYFIGNYNMYSYLYDDEVLVLREIEAEVRAAINTATTVAEAEEAYKSGTARIWKYFEYNQKAYTEYRRALEAFENLSAETKAAAMRELSSLSYRVAENWRAIRALIEKYTGEAN